MCRSRRELSNAYFLANVGFDAAENEPLKVCPLSCTNPAGGFQSRRRSVFKNFGRGARLHFARGYGRGRWKSQADASGRVLETRRRRDLAGDEGHNLERREKEADEKEAGGRVQEDPGGNRTGLEDSLPPW